MAVVFEKTKVLTDKVMHYCPGCTHGIIHRLIAEVIDEMGIQEQTIGVGPVGCAAFIDDYFNLDFCSASHGRAPAAATGIKRALPDKIVFSYQGDGDIAAIGTAEIVHAALRGEKITSLFVNNAIYGMTGGQMAPTTLVGQKTTTSPKGRDKNHAGSPMKLSEMLATLDGAVYIARVSVHDPKHVNQAKKCIRKAIEVQQKGLGFALIEVLSICPTNWGMSPKDSIQWLKDNMIPVYPIGEIKIPEGVE